MDAIIRHAAIDEAEIGDACIETPSIVRTAGTQRRGRNAAVIASLALHAGILAATLASLVGEAPSTDPEPIVVELVVAADTSGMGAGSGTGDSAGGGGGGSAAPAEAGTVTQSPTEPKSPPAAVAIQPPDPSPPRRPRPEARRPSNEAPSPRQAVSAPRAALPDPTPPVDVLPPAQATPQAQSGPEATADNSSDGHNKAVSGGGSMAGGTSAGSGASGNGRNSGSGSGSGTGGGSGGPGFSLGSAANPMPDYPPAARRRGIEGTVVLRVEVSAEGRPLAVEIAKSSGSDSLDEAARAAIARWRFRPATRAGEAVAATASVPVRFRLLDR
ncbi:MAG: energy transducer TonB [Rhodospirillales bacterium]